MNNQINAIALNNETLTSIEIFAIQLQDKDIRDIIHKLTSEIRTLQEANAKLVNELKWEQNPARFKNRLFLQALSSNNLPSSIIKQSIAQLK